MVQAILVDRVSEIDAVEIDRNLRSIAARRAGLDAELGRWLRHADQRQIWNQLGFVHALEYLEDVFGFTPRSGRERMRVAHELAELPAFESALEHGTLSYGVVRELTRVATAETESRWLAAARGKNLRQVERLVAGHEKGDTPDDDVNPELFDCIVEWKLPAPIAALLRETRKHLNDEVGEHLEDAHFVEMLCRRALEQPSAVAAEATSESPATGFTMPATGPLRMIHITTCRNCQTASKVGGGRRIPISVTELELASCDAAFVDDEQGKRPTQTIPAAIRRHVMERDEHSCRVPGCRSARNLDVHHLIPRCEGGQHELWNLVVLCSGHHRLHHEGVLSINGRADQQLTFVRRGRAVVEGKDGHVLRRHALPEDRDARVVGRHGVEDKDGHGLMLQVDTETRDEATVHAATAVHHQSSVRRRNIERNSLAARALHDLGFTHATAADAVRRAAFQVAADADLQTLLREALRYCR